MYRIKMGYHIFSKKLLLNILIVLQLLIIIVGVNSTVAFASSQNNAQNIAKNLKGTQTITVAPFRSNNIDSVIAKLCGKPLLYNHHILENMSTDNERLCFNGFDYTILSSLSYKLQKGKWFDKVESGSNKVVVSHNSKYKVGDSVALSHESKRINFEIVGMFKPKEELFNLSGCNGKIERIFARSNESINFYFDSSFTEIAPTLPFSSQSQFILKFAEQLSQDEFAENQKLLTDYGVRHYNVDQLYQNSHDEKKLIYSVMWPIIFFILAISFLSFLMINIISYGSCKYDLQVISNMGASKKDLMMIMGSYLSFPMLIVLLIFFIFGKVLFLPFSTNAIVTWINYLITILIVVLFFISNYLLLFKKVFSKSGLKESINYDK